MLEDKLNQDLKLALLSKDELRVSTLRSIKNAFLYAKVAENARDASLPDPTASSILRKEAKKRQESADLFIQGGSREKAAHELAEKAIIEEYLPERLSEAQVAALIDDLMLEAGGREKLSLGELVRLARDRSAGAAEGAVIARIAKERLET